MARRPNRGLPSSYSQVTKHRLVRFFVNFLKMLFVPAWEATIPLQVYLCHWLVSGLIFIYSFRFCQSCVPCTECTDLYRSSTSMPIWYVRHVCIARQVNCCPLEGYMGGLSRPENSAVPRHAWNILSPCLGGRPDREQ